MANQHRTEWKKDISLPGSERVIQQTLCRVQALTRIDRGIPPKKNYRCEF